MVASLEDFEVGGYVGRSQPRPLTGCLLGEGDVVRAVRRSDSAVLAMKRVEVSPEPGKAATILGDLTRASGLTPHSVWLGQHPDASFVHEYVDKMNCRHARCCILEELADTSLEQEIIQRAVQNNPFAGLLGIWAALLHGLQAFHAQGCLHRGICPRNIFFKDGSVKLGMPGPEGMPAAAGYYAGGECMAYSADIFALGLVFLEMAVLHQSNDLVGGGRDAAISELRSLSGGVAGLRNWLWDRCALLGLAAPDDTIVEVLGAVLSPSPVARPTTDDVLEWPCFAPFVDPLQLLPVCQRPCVVLSHRTGIRIEDVPRRTVLTLPGFHQIFSRDGAETIAHGMTYEWCGEEHKLWWHSHGEPRPVQAKPLGDQASLLDEVPTGIGLDDSEGAVVPALTSRAAFEAATRADDAAAAARTLAKAAGRLRSQEQPLAAEVLWRGALAAEARLSDEEGRGSFQSWLGLASSLFERENLMAAKRVFAMTRLRAQEEEQAAGGVTAVVHDSRLYGLCELFLAAETTAGRLLAEPQTSGGDGNGIAGALRAAHVALYFRSALAIEAGSWEVLAALGEFYRLIGCPEPPFSSPVPDNGTARSYFEQAQAMAPSSAFVLDRLAACQEPAESQDRVASEAGVA